MNWLMSYIKIEFESSKKIINLNSVLSIEYKKDRMVIIFSPYGGDRYSFHRNDVKNIIFEENSFNYYNFIGYEILNWWKENNNE